MGSWTRTKFFLGTRAGSALPPPEFKASQLRDLNSAVFPASLACKTFPANQATLFAGKGGKKACNFPDLAFALGKMGMKLIFINRVFRAANEVHALGRGL